MGNAIATACHLTPRQWALLAPELRDADDWVWLPPNPDDLDDSHVAAIRALHPGVDSAIVDIARASIHAASAVSRKTDGAGEPLRGASQAHTHHTTKGEPRNRARRSA